MHLPSWYNEVTGYGLRNGWDIGIVVPVRDEARRLEACLSALDTAIDGRNVGLVIVINNSTDPSAAIARSWFRETRRSGVLVNCTIPLAWSNVGRVRDIGLSIALRRIQSGGVLMMTDADCRVHDDWITANMEELRRADVVCGHIDGDAEEGLQLPDAVHDHFRWETSYLRSALNAVSRLDPLVHDPRPVHRSTPGASLAFRHEVYRTIGMHPLPVDEDRTFVAHAERADYRIRYSETARVIASCRTTGRTPGGMAGTLRSRTAESDPLCDPWLEPAATLVLRHRFRGLMRRAFPDRHAMLEVLRQVLDMSDMIAASNRLGAILSGIENRAPALARHRVRQSEIPRELDRLERLMAQSSEGLTR